MRYHEGGVIQDDAVDAPGEEAGYTVAVNFPCLLTPGAKTRGNPDVSSRILDGALQFRG